MRDTMPVRSKTNESAIVNLDSNRGPGTHWVAFRKRGNIVDYFDSFGNLRPPPELVDYFGPAVHIRYNNVRQQGFDSVQCGRLCLKFLDTKHRCW